MASVRLGNNKAIELSGLDSYVNIHNVIQEFCGKFSSDDPVEFENFSFCLLGPDAIKTGKYKYIIESISDAGFSIIEREIFSVISERALEELYKYHVPDAVKSTPTFTALDCDLKRYCYFQKTVPTRNWRLLRKRYTLGPSVALIVRRPNGQATAILKELKGATDPLKCQLGQFRYTSDNPCMSILHSSDDAVSFIRESLLFFESIRMQEIIVNAKPLKVNEVVKYIEVCIPREAEYRFLVIALYLRLRLTYKLVPGPESAEIRKFYEERLAWVKEINAGAALLKHSSQLLEDEKVLLDKIGKLGSEDIVWLFKLLADKKRFAKWPSEKFRWMLDSNGIVLSPHEEMVFEAGCYYYRDV